MKWQKIDGKTEPETVPAPDGHQRHRRRSRFLLLLWDGKSACFGDYIADYKGKVGGFFPLYGNRSEKPLKFMEIKPPTEE